MYLAKVETDSVEAMQAPEIGSCSLKWRQWPASTISHHGKACCEVAREWVIGTDFSQLGEAGPMTGPRWLRQKYPWGPSPWPLHWCEAVERERLDCGAHAAISHELFIARGVRSLPAQFVQLFSRDATRHWAHKWDDDNLRSEWIDGDLIYHEGCAVLTGDDGIKLWDASAGWWINPGQTGGYGGLLGVRIFDPEGVQPAPLRWGAHRLPLNVWVDL
jgi:hypothetical protein